MHSSATTGHGDRLVTMRKEAGILKKDVPTLFNRLAKERGLALQIGRRALSRWETLGTPRHRPSYGYYPPTLAELEILLDVYNGNPEYLFSGSGPPIRAPLALNDHHLRVIRAMNRWAIERQQEFADHIESFYR